MHRKDLFLFLGTNSEQFSFTKIIHSCDRCGISRCCFDNMINAQVWFGLLTIEGFSKMCRFITQHNATHVSSFEGIWHWHADCRTRLALFCTVLYFRVNIILSFYVWKCIVKMTNKGIWIWIWIRVVFPWTECSFHISLPSQHHNVSSVISQYIHLASQLQTTCNYASPGAPHLDSTPAWWCKSKNVWKLSQELQFVYFVVITVVIGQMLTFAVLGRQQIVCMALCDQEVCWCQHCKQSATW